MKVFLANVEPDFVIEESKPKYYLESYYYLKKPIQLQLMKEVDMFLLDSGAFTFMNAKKDKVFNVDEYLNNYIDFINKYDIQYFFELDTDSVHGIDKVLKMRKKLVLGNVVYQYGTNQEVLIAIRNCAKNMTI